MLQTFKAIIAGRATGPTGIEVPPDIMAALGPKKNPAVQITVTRQITVTGHSLTGYSYRSTVAMRGGAFMVPLSAAHRAAGVQAGQQVQVTVALDTVPRTVILPAELEQALTDAGVKAAYGALSPFAAEGGGASGGRRQDGRHPPAPHRQDRGAAVRLLRARVVLSMAESSPLLLRRPQVLHALALSHHRPV